METTPCANNITIEHQTRKPFCCEGCGNDKGFIWKTRQGKETKTLTVFQ